MSLVRTFVLAALVALPVGSPAAAQVTCASVAPRVMEDTLLPGADQAVCGPDARAYVARLAVERVCYDTGMAEVDEVADGTIFKPRTVKVRKGGEVIEKVVPAQPTLRRFIDVSRALDTVNFDIEGVVCVTQDAAEFVSGRWDLSGRDSGQVFSAGGYFPADVIWMRLGGGDQVTVGIDLPPVTLGGDAEPRKIDAAVTLTANAIAATEAARAAEEAAAALEEEAAEVPPPSDVWINGVSEFD